MTEYEKQVEIEELKSTMGAVPVKSVLAGLAVFGLIVAMGKMETGSMILDIVIYPLAFGAIYGLISSLWYFIKGLRNYLVGFILWVVACLGVQHLFVEWALKGDDMIHMVGRVIFYSLLLVIGYGGFVKDFAKVIKLIRLCLIRTYN